MNYIIIGEYKITAGSDGLIHISKLDGEAGGFCSAEFEKIIAQFFEDNF